MSESLRERREPRTDPILLAEVRDWRKDEAWRTLVDRYAPLVRDWTLRAGVGPEDVDDVVQLAWLKVARKIGGFEYDPSRKFRGWLRRLVENHARDHLRRARRDPRPAAVDPAGLGAEPDLGPEEVEHPLLAQARRIQDDVRARVGADAWDAFQSCVLGDEGAVAVARRQGKSPDAIYKAVSRVRMMLREAGEPDAIGDAPRRRTHGG